MLRAMKYGVMPFDLILGETRTTFAPCFFFPFSISSGETRFCACAVMGIHIRGGTIFLFPEVCLPSWQSKPEVRERQIDREKKERRERKR